MRLWGAFEAEPKCLTLPSEAHKKRRGRPASCREGGKEAVRLWGAFEAEPKCLTLPSEAHKKRGGRLRTGHREAARGLPAAEKLRTGHREAARGRKAFEGGPKCLNVAFGSLPRRGQGRGEALGSV